MAVGYHKLNTSAARSRRRSARDEIPRDRIEITPAGSLLWDPLFGNGTTLEDFVDDSDNVKCKFDSGFTVVLRGGAVRIGINDRAKGVGQ